METKRNILFIMRLGVKNKKINILYYIILYCFIYGVCFKNGIFRHKGFRKIKKIIYYLLKIRNHLKRERKDIVD
mgnify:CR=1 FL=1